MSLADSRALAAPDTSALDECARVARGLAMDGVHKANSGHLGLPLGAAEYGAVLFGHMLRHHPAEPRWLDRDRFVLSAGHGSMFLYGWLHLSGYALSLDDLKKFRQWGSITPGHPEYGMTAGVECTTGPLGQGVGNAVGMALASKRLEALFNTSEHKLISHRIWCFAGDGCLQEGVAAEAAALAGHMKLDNLVLTWDSNDVTLDAPASKTQTEDTAARFAAYGFEVIRIEKGNDVAAIHAGLLAARNSTSGKPRFVILRSQIGRGIPEVAGTFKAHGEAGAPHIDKSRVALGLPADQHFVVTDAVKGYFEKHRARLAAEHAEWKKTETAWRSAHADKAQALDALASGNIPSGLLAKIPAFAADQKIATRKASETVIQAIADAVPSLIGGSADLHGSTFNYIKSSGDFEPATRDGRNIRFGIREHAMGALCNGIAYDAHFRPMCATFMVFADYLRPSIRLAALSHLPVTYVFTHDSIGVGEDGPTHQPVETVAGLRLIPNLDVIRPADPEETAGAWVAALERKNGPTVLSLTRQALPYLEGSVDAKRNGVARGAYILKHETSALERILIATGSEVSLAMEAAAKLGGGTRVVSMPSMYRFGKESEAYRNEVLPPSCRKRVAIEAGVSFGWDRWVGDAGKIIAIDRFGASAPAPTIFKEFGLSVDNLVKVAGAL